MLENIIKLHKQGHFDQAESACRAHLKAHPEDHQGHFLLGGLLIQGNRLSDAMEPVNRAVSLAPDRADYLITLGRLQVRLGRTDAARQSFAAAIRLDPNSAQAYTGLARLAAADGNRQEAERYTKLALRADPDWADALLLAGSLASDRGDHEEAVRGLGRLAKRHPRSAHVQSALGRAFLAQGSAAFAEQALRNAIALNPDMPGTRAVLARALMAQDRHDEVVELLRDNHGEEPEALLALGEAYLWQGAFADAVQVLGPLDARSPGNTSATESLAIALLELNRFEEASALIEQWRQSNPGARGAYACKAELERRRDDFGAMVATQEQWLAVQPNDVDARERLALTLEKSDPERAYHHASAALSVRPGSVTALLVTARASLRNGDPAAARATLLPLLDAPIEPATAQAVHRTLGAACHALGERSQAVAHWQAAQQGSVGTLSISALASAHELASARPDGDLNAHANSGDTARVSHDLSTETGREPSGLMPVFLVAAPGVDAGHVGTILADLGVPSLVDRFAMGTPRTDGYGEFDAEAFERDGLQARADAFAAAYQEGIARTGIEAGRVFVDVLPVLDARWLPVFERAIPASRVLILTRTDSRDAYLNWLACGTQPQPSVSDLVASATWHQQVAIHFRHAAAFRSVHVLDLDALLAEDAFPADIAALFSLAASVRPTRFRASLGPVSGLPVWLEAEVWRTYAEVLSEPFAMLDANKHQASNPGTSS